MRTQSVEVPPVAVLVVGPTQQALVHSAIHALPRSFSVLVSPTIPASTRLFDLMILLYPEAPAIFSSSRHRIPLIVVGGEFASGEGLGRQGWSTSVHPGETERLRSIAVEFAWPYMIRYRLLRPRLATATPIVRRALETPFSAPLISLEDATEALASGGAVFPRTVQAVAERVGASTSYLSQGTQRLGLRLSWWTRAGVFLRALSIHSYLRAPWHLIHPRLGIPSPSGWTNFVRRVAHCSPTEASRRPLTDWVRWAMHRMPPDPAWEHTRSESQQSEGEMQA